MTIKEVLIKSAKRIAWSPTPFLDAEIIISHVLNKDRTFLNTHDQDSIPQESLEKINHLTQRREKHEPVAYIINEKEFFGRTFFVNNSVLIPRPETELLVEESLKFLFWKELKTIIEIGTGSGCIVTTIAKELYDKDPILTKKIKFIATDISNEALQIARRNADRILANTDIEINFVQSDLFEKVEKQNATLIISNLPYVPSDEYESLEANVKDYEPQVALVGGTIGTEIIERFLDESKQFSDSETKIFLEIHSQQGDSLLALAKKYHPNKKVCIIKDYANLDRIASIG